MSGRPRPSTGGFFTNLRAGPYGPIERARVAFANVLRKRGGKGCCGNYGEPGC
jgi:hypothetical protein